MAVGSWYKPVALSLPSCVALIQVFNFSRSLLTPLQDGRVSANTAPTASTHLTLWGHLPCARHCLKHSINTFNPPNNPVGHKPPLFPFYRSGRMEHGAQRRARVMVREIRLLDRSQAAGTWQSSDSDLGSLVKPHAHHPCLILPAGVVGIKGKDASGKCLATLRSSLNISCRCVKALVTDVFDRSYCTYSYEKIKLKHEKAYRVKHGCSNVLSNPNITNVLIGDSI